MTNVQNVKATFHLYGTGTSIPTTHLFSHNFWTWIHCEIATSIPSVVLRESHEGLRARQDIWAFQRNPAFLPVGFCWWYFNIRQAVGHLPEAVTVSFQAFSKYPQRGLIIFFFHVHWPHVILQRWEVDHFSYLCLYMFIKIMTISSQTVRIWSLERTVERLWSSVGPLLSIKAMSDIYKLL